MFVAWMLMLMLCVIVVGLFNFVSFLHASTYSLHPCTHVVLFPHLYSSVFLQCYSQFVPTPINCCLAYIPWTVHFSGLSLMAVTYWWQILSWKHPSCSSGRKLYFPDCHTYWAASAASWSTLSSLSSRKFYLCCCTLLAACSASSNILCCTWGKRSFIYVLPMFEIFYFYVV